MHQRIENPPGSGKFYGYRRQIQPKSKFQKIIPRLPLPLLAALILSQPVPQATAAAPISWDSLMQGWQDGSLTETVLALDVDGTVFFKDGASIDGFHTELYQGSLSMGEGTAIQGTLEAWQEGTFIIDGFTTMDGQYSVHAVKPGVTHTVLIRMEDSMAAATEENPVFRPPVCGERPKRLQRSRRTLCLPVP